MIISAALSPRGAPGRLFRFWLEGAYELVISEILLDELRRALAYPKLTDRIPPTEAEALLDLLSRGGAMTEDPDKHPGISSPDPDDDYLIALASHTRSILVSGDNDLLQLANQLPVYSPAEFVALVERGPAQLQ